tara:strand:- start:1283 stop:1405 length:123 start_codon:yes stop_codon:yes gene_type:complete
MRKIKAFFFRIKQRNNSMIKHLSLKEKLKLLFSKYEDEDE